MNLVKDIVFLPLLLLYCFLLLYWKGATIGATWESTNRATLLSLFETTKEFVKTVNDIKIPPMVDTASMKQEYFPGARLLVNMTFLDSGAEKEKSAGADQPLVSALIKKYGVDVNIISGKVDYLKDTPYGTLLVEIMGDEKSIRDAVQYARDAGVRLEVIGYVG